MMPKNSGWDPDQITSLLLQAGETALAYQQQLHITCKADGSVVTQADTEIEDFLTVELESPADGMYLIGEETEASRGQEYIDAALQKNAYIIDPIDGTAPYSNRLPIWGISIGYASGGRITDGAVYLPAFGEIFLSSGDEVHCLQVREHEVTSQVTLERRHPQFNSTGIISITQGLAKYGTVDLPNVVQALCCAVVPLCYLLQAKYMVYVANLKIWDLAGALPLLSRHGFEATLLDGTVLTDQIDESVFNLAAVHPQRWKTKTPCIFGPPGMAAHLIEKIRQ